MTWFNIVKLDEITGLGMVSQFLTEIFNIPLEDIRALRAKGLMHRGLTDVIQHDYVRDITEEDFNYVMEFMEKGEYDKGIEELIKVTQPIKDYRNRVRRMMANRKKREKKGE